MLSLARVARGRPLPRGRHQRPGRRATASESGSRCPLHTPGTIAWLHLRWTKKAQTPRGSTHHSHRGRGTGGTRGAPASAARGIGGHGARLIREEAGKQGRGRRRISPLATVRDTRPFERGRRGWGPCLVSGHQRPPRPLRCPERGSDHVSLNLTSRPRAHGSNRHGP